MSDSNLGVGRDISDSTGVVGEKNATVTIRGSEGHTVLYSLTRIEAQLGSNVAAINDIKFDMADFKRLSEMRARQTDEMERQIEKLQIWAALLTIGFIIGAVFNLYQYYVLIVR